MPRVSTVWLKISLITRLLFDVRLSTQYGQNF